MPGSRPRVTAAPAPCLKMSRGVTWVHPPKRGGGRAMKENSFTKAYLLNGGTFPTFFGGDGPNPYQI